MEKRETLTVGEQNYGYSPYHAWVMGVLYYTVIAIVALTYWRHTGKLKGAIIIFAIGSVLALFLVEDITYFVIQKQSIPEKWMWLYYPASFFSTGDYVSGQTVVTLALLGITISVFL